MSARATPRILHLLATAGVSGDMWLGLLLDLGLDAAELESLPDRLGLEGVAVRCGRARRGAFDAARVEVDTAGAAGHGRHLDEIERRIDAAGLPQAVADRAKDAFMRLFAAEARVHGSPLERTHLHEAGADDALVDVCGTMLGLARLGIDEVSCAVPLPVGGGTVRAEHGELPVPAPATAELLAGIEIRGGPVERELVTPTGAAILRTVVDRWGAAPEMTLEATGRGAGTADDPALPNVLTGLLGTPLRRVPRDERVTVLETTLDDMLPQDVPVLVERLLAEGALDAVVIPLQMKKGRPGFRLEALAAPERAEALARLLLEETTTLGVRLRDERRLAWDRDTVSVDTPFGPVRVKRARDAGGRALRAQPEFEDCAERARETGTTPEAVRRAARDAAERAGDDDQGDDR
ncbi:MAG: nickel pincer cofactor biosynthesis protein LarC [Acidobacteria bacterium]|nr:MAG: nickel pincer cofactor biosynthesis protein LarC [Acidobacteriota bacterium]